MAYIEIDKLKSDLCDILQLEIEPNLINDNTNIINDFELDSLDIVDLMISLEEVYDLELEEFNVNEIKTVSDLHYFLNNIDKVVSGTN